MFEELTFEEEFEGYARRIVGVEPATVETAYRAARAKLVAEGGLAGIEGGKVIPLTKRGAFVVVFAVEVL